MQKIIISGCHGRMGRVIERLCTADPQLDVIAGFDLVSAVHHEYPVYATPASCPTVADVVVDFSHPSALTGLLDYCTANGCRLVLATTGHSPVQRLQLLEAAEHIPIFRSANIALGINLVLALARKSAAVLGELYDIEIVERHHSKKVDAPSGTALMLADAISEELPFRSEYVYDRHTNRGTRRKQEIGISSLRGGSIVGDHEIIFAGKDEVIEIHHHALSREAFATGAVHATKFLTQINAPGLYGMDDLLDTL